MEEFSKNYHSILFGKYASLNLTRISDPEEFDLKQIEDSLFPAKHFPVFDKCLSKGLHIDVGFGGGFPLLPLAEKYKETRFLGFEARRKKADAVQDIAEMLGLKNVTTYHCRVENIIFDRECSISFKAVGKIKEFLKKINTTKPVTVFFYKGPQLKELEPTPEKIENFIKILDEEYTVPGGLKRTFVAYKGQNVPRGTKKDLVKLSELL